MLKIVTLKVINSAKAQTVYCVATLASGESAHSSMNISLHLCTLLVAILFVIYAIDIQDDKKSSLEELL